MGESPAGALTDLVVPRAADPVALPPAPDVVTGARDSSPVQAIDLPAAALERVWAAVEASTSANTKAAYRSDWARFTGWAVGAGHLVLPADPLVVAAYLTGAAAEQGAAGQWRYSPATLTRWASSINQFHTAAGFSAPGRSEVVRRALSGIRRVRKTPPNRRAPLLLEDIARLLTAMAPFSAWPGGVIARRDAALLLIGFATAARRSELIGLTVGDVATHRVDGLHLRWRTSKTDQEARGTVKAVPYGRDPVTCPPCAYTRWRLLLDAADSVAPDGQQRRSVMTELRRQHADQGVDGHVCRLDLPDPVDPGRALFPLVHKTGRIGAAGMSGQALNVVLARRATDAGYTPEQVAKLGGHSLRAGFVTEAFRRGADAHAIMRQTGHRNPAILETYAREHAPLVGNAVTTLGL